MLHPCEAFFLDFEMLALQPNFHRLKIWPWVKNHWVCTLRRLVSLYSIQRSQSQRLIFPKYIRSDIRWNVRRQASFYRVGLQKAGMTAKAFSPGSHVIQVLLTVDLAQCFHFDFSVLMTQRPAPLGTAKRPANTPAVTALETWTHPYSVLTQKTTA